MSSLLATTVGTMRAWRLERPGGRLALEQISKPEIGPGAVLVRMAAVPLLSYTKAYVAGELPYAYPPGPFTIGTNGTGRVEAVGDGVNHVHPGDRVLVNPFLTADEPVAEPARILIGLTGISPDSGRMLSSWRDGTLAEYVAMPGSTVVPALHLDEIADERLAALGKFAVPLGGLMRGRLVAGETLVVHGASGYFGSAAVMLGLALGAARVVAVARNRETLDELALLSPHRIFPVALSGDVSRDTKAIRLASDGAADLVFDQVGRASDNNGFMSALRSLRRGGRLVLMGSAMTPLSLDYNEIMINDWEIVGNFMYAKDAYPKLLSLVRAELLDLESVRIRVFAFEQLVVAMEAAGAMSGLDCTVLSLRS